MIVIGAIAGFLIAHDSKTQQPAKQAVQADFTSLMELIANVNRERRESDDDQGATAGFFTFAAVAGGMAAGALLVWFLVRLVNCRREQRGRFLSVGLLAVIAAYPISFGPACWIIARSNCSAHTISMTYYPIVWLANRSSHVSMAAAWYADIGANEAWDISFEGDKISWWVSGPGSIMPYRTTISCNLGIDVRRDSTKDAFLIELSESDRTSFGKVAFEKQDEIQRVFSAIWALESEVNNGGFDQYFRNSDSEK
jgi:hypothetical protein